MKLHDATGSLVSALKAPAVRGRWGEMQLRRVVELAGMLAHCDFDEQTTLAGDDGRLRPDMIISLPGGRRIVVDAKAPLGAYLEAREAPDDETRAAKYRQHAAQVRAHVMKLGAKNYWDALDAAPDMVVMFLPGEPLYSVALEQMPELIEEGVAQKVMIATPTTLLALLRTASFGWREERLAENAERIADEGRKLHERIATVLEHFSQLGRALGQSVKHFNAAMVSFDRNLVSSARRLAELDAKGKKELPDRAQIDARPFTVTVDEAALPRKRLPQQPMLTLAPPPRRRSTRNARARRGLGGGSVDFVEPARPFALELVGGRGHYERVVRAAMEARRSVWIATANLKELMVEDHRAAPGRRRTMRTGSAFARPPTDRYWRCSTSWPRAASSCASCTRRRRRVRSAPRWRAGRRWRARCAARLSARAFQGGDRRRRVRLRRQRQLDGRGPGREGDGAAQLRARLRGLGRRPARSRAGALRSNLAGRRLQGLQAARHLSGTTRR